MKSIAFVPEPLRRALVFVSHSCVDHDEIGDLVSALSAHFAVYCDHYTDDRAVWARYLSSDDDRKPVPRQVIVQSAAFLFLASEASLAPTSRALPELGIAEGLKSDAPIVITVALNNYLVPRDREDTVYLHYSSAHAPRDAARVVKYVSDQLCARLGIQSTQIGGIANGPLLLGGKNLARMLEALTSDYKTRILPGLNTIIQFGDLESLVSAIKTEPITTQKRIAERLVEIYVLEQGNPRFELLRETSIVIASRILPEKWILDEIRRREPDFDTPVLYRGAGVIVPGALGDRERCLDYAMSIDAPTRPLWRAQRNLNLEFHVVYYGGVEPSLKRLRSNLDNMTPEYLLPIGVVTIGELSFIQKDIDRLEAKRAALVALGLPSALIDSAITKIRTRMLHGK